MEIKILNCIANIMKVFEKYKRVEKVLSKYKGDPWSDSILSPLRSLIIKNKNILICLQLLITLYLLKEQIT
jgi:hypothetical protein